MSTSFKLTGRVPRKHLTYASIDFRTLTDLRISVMSKDARLQVFMWQVLLARLYTQLCQFYCDKYT